MRTRTRLLFFITAILVGLGFLGAACFGGPTSDFPANVIDRGDPKDDAGATGGDSTSNNGGGGTTTGGTAGGSPSNGESGMDAGIHDMDAGADDGGV